MKQAHDPEIASHMRAIAASFLLLPIALFAVPTSPDRIPNPRRQAQTGRIAGTVEISTALASRRPQFRIYSDPRHSTTPRSDLDELKGELRNVVVYMQDDSRLKATDATKQVGIMSQRGERFAPHVVPVLQGGRVEFPNEDDLYHNVFSLSRARSFDLGRYPRGATRGVTFPRAGVVQVFCHIHADMSGIVLVLPNPFFATPDTTGRYVIENVPPGEYSVVGWHERTRPVTTKVRVVAGETATVNFQLPLNASNQ